MGRQRDMGYLDGKKRWVATVITAAALGLGAGCGAVAADTGAAPSTSKTTSTSASRKPAASKLSKEQANAIRSAKSYLETMPFSRKGLIKQLSSKEGDGYSVKDATFAVDSLKVDYNKQAARAAKNYLELQGFSRKGLIQQLTSTYGDNYTRAQAEYGVKAAGL